MRATGSAVVQTRVRLPLVGEHSMAQDVESYRQIVPRWWLGDVTADVVPADPGVST
jgi:hypothetical protein